MKLTLIEKKQETSDCLTFIFLPEQPLSWKAGQFLSYELPHEEVDERGLKRFFTIAAAPFEQNPRITTRFTPQKGSSFKNHLYGLEVGQSLEATGPNGSFILDDPHKKYVFIAGGIGITPFRAILLDLKHQKQPLNITLLYANRNQEIVFKAELEHLTETNPEFKIHYAIDPQKINAEFIKPKVEGQSDKHYFLSGPKPFVEGMEKVLEELEVSKEKIKTDYFPGYSE